MHQIFDEVQKISKFGRFDMPLGSTFEIGTQIILLKFDGSSKVGSQILTLLIIKYEIQKVRENQLGKSNVHFNFDKLTNVQILKVLDSKRCWEQIG